MKVWQGRSYRYKTHVLLGVAIIPQFGIVMFYVIPLVRTN